MPMPKLSRSQLDLLSHNLQNIYAAAHDIKTPSLEIVPSLFSHELYCPSIGWKGRSLRLIYAGIIFFAGKSFFEKKLANALQATQECYLKLENFRHQYHDKIYQDHLTQQFKNLPSRFSQKEIHNARQQIRAFFQATYPLSKLVRNQKNDKLNAFLKIHFKDLIERGTKPFICERRFESLKGHIKIMALEGFTEGNLPLNIFQKKGVLGPQVENIEKIDKKRLIAFIKKMQRSKKTGTFKIDIFHEAMKSIIHHLKKVRFENIYDLKKLEQELIKEGCISLYEFDKKHLKWREGLKKDEGYVKLDEPFYFLNQQYEKFLFVLDELVPGIPKDEDRFKVYEIRDPVSQEKFHDRLMIIGPNRVCLEYSDLLRTESFWGLETHEIQFIHPKGKYAIVEKLPHAIDTLDWSSDQRGLLKEDDKRYADPLRLLMRFFMEEQNSPQNFKAEYLKFDAKGRLKAIKDCIPCGFIDYIALDEIAYQLAKQEYLSIYQYIIEPLREQKFSQARALPFFKESILSVFESRSVNIEILAKKHRIKDQKIIKRGKNLQEFSHRMQKEASEILQEHHPTFPFVQIESNLAKCLLQLYENDKTFGRFWNDVGIEELIEAFENTF